MRTLSDDGCCCLSEMIDLSFNARIDTQTAQIATLTTELATQRAESKAEIATLTTEFNDRDAESKAEIASLKDR